MKIVVSSSDEQFEELSSGISGVEWIRVTEHAAITNSNADAYFLLDEPAGKITTPEVTVPVFVNSVTLTLEELGDRDLIRINGWNGFISRKTWEAAGKVDTAAQEIASSLDRKLIAVADEPGLVTARVVSMIVNEAFFALGESVSTRAEIDTAMKLGTNYPFGPFEWSDRIGIEKIKGLLNKLSLTDKRYLPAPSLITATAK